MAVSDDLEIWLRGFAREVSDNAVGMGAMVFQWACATGEDDRMEARAAIERNLYDMLGMDKGLPDSSMSRTSDRMLARGTWDSLWSEDQKDRTLEERLDSEGVENVRFLMGLYIRRAFSVAMELGEKDHE